MLLKPKILNLPDNVTDFSFDIRRSMQAYGGTELLGLYVNNRQVYKITASEYRYTQWQEHGRVGEGKAVAVAFDGEWALNSSGQWQLITKDEPWIFWVDLAGNLYARGWAGAPDAVLLDTGVVTVAAIRAWRNVNFPTHDHGIIAAYIKVDGKVYYRNYCTQADGTRLWELARLVPTGTDAVKEISLFLTNDFRTGIITQDVNDTIKWLITERNWAGMALPPEIVSVAPGEITVDLIPMTYIDGIETEYLSAAPGGVSMSLLYALTHNEIISAINTPVSKIDDAGEEYLDWGWVIEFEAVNAMPNLGLSQVTFTDLVAGTPIGIISIEKINGNKYKANVDPIAEAGINNVFGDINITIAGALNPAGYTYQTISKDFTPINLVPEDIPLPVPVEVWNE